ncbi:MAG: hypothetical protein P8J14_12070 [Emcibacteraceae bacterium]|nr:hypothetical protein [Emcibacteraceae bacterium]
MTKDMSNSELLEDIKSHIKIMPRANANEIALLLLFAEYAAYAHPLSSIPKGKNEKVDDLQGKISNIINDLSKSERDRLAPLIRGVQMIKILSKEKF